MKEDDAVPPPQPVTVTTDRVVTLTTKVAVAEPLQQAIMHAERQHKEAWRRLAHQPGVTLGPVIDTKARAIMLEALRRIAELDGPHAGAAGLARDALLMIGDRSIAPLDDTNVP
jgi:hypothetical protein